MVYEQLAVCRTSVGILDVAVGDAFNRQQSPRSLLTINKRFDPDGVACPKPIETGVFRLCLRPLPIEFIPSGKYGLSPTGCYSKVLANPCSTGSRGIPRQSMADGRYLQGRRAEPEKKAAGKKPCRETPA